MMKTYKQFIEQSNYRNETELLRELLSPEIELSEGFVTTASKAVALAQLSKAKGAVSKLKNSKDVREMLLHLGDAIIVNSTLQTIAILNISDINKQNKKKGRR
jgi:hypothetical protein